MSFVVVNFGGEKVPCKGIIRIDGTNSERLYEGYVIPITSGTHVLEFERSLNSRDVVNIFTESMSGLSIAEEDYSIKRTITIEENSILKFVIVTDKIGNILAKPTFTIEKYTEDAFQTKKSEYEAIEKEEIRRITETKSSPNSGSGGCYVATAIYGSYDCPQVWVLRRYRDEILAKTWCGRLFIHLYYAVSPTIVHVFGKTKWFKKLWKPKLDRLVSQLRQRGVSEAPYNDKKW